MRGRILVVEDDRLKRLTLEKQLGDADHSVVSCDNAFAAIAAVEEGPFDVVLTDLRMPGMDGVSLLKRVREIAPETHVIVMTAYGSIQNAVEAIHAGASDYVTKPFTFEEIDLKIQRLVEHSQTVREVQELRARLSDRYSLDRMIAQSKSMREVFDLARVLAVQDVPILILGETGTGKELLARGIHATSPRAREPFVAVNCAALSPHIVESEIFGHEAGAFTGALRQRRGRIELAGKGTLFLDDIDDLPLDFQVKLLRVLQEREYERVGGEAMLQMNARLISASKQDPRQLVQEGKLRADLAYRVDVVRIALPPIRERKEDIPMLIAHFSARAASPREFSCDAMRILLDYNWPGNVRELENVVAHVHAVGRPGQVSIDDLPAYLKEGDREARPFALHLNGRERIDLPAMLRAIEEACVQWAMVRAKGNQSAAADMLGMPRTTLRRFLTAPEANPAVDQA
ncbi:MAG: sigma-54-dependent Fis family transcriptional regulator [Planctomycetes bacterium]|nr:sigma-54-dependent Fis family transcriptional regulator [Planctomycetota bacterium]